MKNGISNRLVDLYEDFILVFFNEDFSETTENIKQKIVDILPNYKL